MLFFITLFLPNFVNKKSSQTGACASTQSMDELKALNIVAALHLPPGHVSDGLHQGGPVGVETLGPVVSSPGLDREVLPHLNITTIIHNHHHQHHHKIKIY